MHGYHKIIINFRDGLEIFWYLQLDSNFVGKFIKEVLIEMLDKLLKSNLNIKIRLKQAHPEAT